jgi:hypothetical protein
MKQYALALFLAPGFLAFPQSPTIKIRIADLPSIPVGIVPRAEVEAGALLESGGIKVIWRDCLKAGACQHQLSADELILHLRAPSRQTKQEGSQHDVLGCATTNSAGTGVSGWIDYDLVQMTATREGAAPELLLANAIAHEVGHLLGLAHEPLGLMQAHWNSREMQQLARAYLHFNGKQRQRLQTEVLARMVVESRSRSGPGNTSKTEIPGLRIEARDRAQLVAQPGK